MANLSERAIGTLLVQGRLREAGELRFPALQVICGTCAADPVWIRRPSGAIVCGQCGSLYQAPVPIPERP